MQRNGPLVEGRTKVPHWPLTVPKTLPIWVRCAIALPSTLIFYYPIDFKYVSTRFQKSQSAEDVRVFPRI